MSKFLLATSVAAILVFGSTANAGIVWEINYVGSFDSSFQPITVDLSDASTNDPSYTHQIEFRFSMIEDGDFSAATDDFAAATFDLNLGSGISNSPDAPGWQPSDGQFVFDRPVFGAPTKKSQWTKNADTGQDDASSDLKAILVQVDDAPVANNRQYGEVGRPSTGEADRDGGAGDLGYPTLVGGLFVKWDGTTSELSLVKAAGNALGLWVDNNGGSGTFEAFEAGFEGATLQFGSDVPTGASVGLGDGGNGVDVTLDNSLGNTRQGLSLPSAGVIEIVNHPGTESGDLEVWLNVTGDVDIAAIISDLNDGDVAIALGAVGNPFDDAPANLMLTFPGLAPMLTANDGIIFSYDFGAGAGIDTITVPEPTSMLLAGLGLVGLAGIRRRRRNG